MSEIKEITVMDRLNQNNSWASLEDMRNYCNSMADMMDDFIQEFNEVLAEKDKLKEALDKSLEENKELQEKIEELEELEELIED